MPPTGSPISRPLSRVATSGASTEYIAVDEPAQRLPHQGTPFGVAANTAPVRPETVKAIEAEKERSRIREEAAVRGKIVDPIPYLRLPRALLGGGFLLGIIAILSLVGLYLFAQTLTLLAQIAILPPTVRWVAYAVLLALLAGVLIGTIRLLAAYLRLRRTQRISLGGIDDLNQRAEYRKLAAEETDKAYQIVGEYLEKFPTERQELMKLGFSDVQTAKLLESRKHLSQLGENGLGAEHWLQTFRHDFQSVVDEAADDCITRHAKQVGFKVAALPLPLLETAVVLHGAFTMVADLCRIYQLRLGKSGTLIVTGWAVVQGVTAGEIDRLTKDDLHSWTHEIGQHFGGVESATSTPHEAAVSALHHGGTVLGASMGDIHIPGLGGIFKRGAKGFLQYVLLRKLGRLTQRWLRMVE
jgi:uncharacterized membrane protein YcjF (UPF0283 family)